MSRPREREIPAPLPESSHRGRRRPTRAGRGCKPGIERLEIRLTPAVRTWTGAGLDNLWSTAANWDVLPVANDDLVFPDIADTARHTAVNDLAAGTAFGSIRIGEAGYTLSGNAISQPGGLFADYGSGSSTISIPMTLSSSFPNTVSVQAGGTLVVGGALSGANGIYKAGAGLALFSQANNYAGVTTISAGTLAISNSSGLGNSSAGNGTTVTDGATLEVRGTINTSEPITIVGAGVGGVGALFNGAGNNVVQSVTLADDATVGVATNTFLLIPTTLAGGAGVDLIKAGGGVLDVLAAASYPGTTTINGGTLAVEGSIAGPTQVNLGGILAGAGGTVGDVASTGGTYNPGFSTTPFSAATGNISLDAASTFVTRLAGTSPGDGSSGYSRVGVAGGVNLGGATLALTTGGGYTPAPEDSYTIIDNDGADAVTGTFAGLPEGSYLDLGGAAVFRISYVGGDGNDVVLTCVRRATTVLASSANPSTFGQGVTFTATVSGFGLTPTGTVSFFDGATLIGTTALVGGVATSPLVDDLATGTRLITATYSGDFWFARGTSPPLSQVVSLPVPTTSVVASPNPSAFGQSVTFTATVSAVAPATGTPTGTITFLDGADPIGTVTLVNGVATFETSALSVGSHEITASYSGDAGFASSTSAATTQVVAKADLTGTLAGSANPSAFGQPVTLTATFAAVAPGAGTPTGVVTFLDGPTLIGTAPLDGSGVATIVVSSFGARSHLISAYYTGDASFEPATPTAVQVVAPAATTATVVATPNPSAIGQPVTFTATVVAASPGAGTPTGTVTFYDGESVLGSGTLVDGVATLTGPLTVVGSHEITASYAGDANFVASISPAIDQIVGLASVEGTLVGPASPSAFGQAVTLTATFAVVAPGVGTPIGVVTFLDGEVPIGTAVLDEFGVASIVVSGLGVGSHSIVASYGGSPGFAPASSPAITQEVVPAATATTLVASAGSSVSGQPVTFTATVAAVAPGAGTPTGVVRFLLDGEFILGFGTVVDGVVTLTTPLTAGSHTISAVYSGPGNFLSSEAAAIGHTVVRATPVVAIGGLVGPYVFGQPVAVTVQVSAASPGDRTPTGVVTLFDGVTPIGTAAVDGSGQATIALPGLAVGSYSLVASYSGDAEVAPGDSAASVLVIGRASATATIATSASQAVPGQPVTLTATVSANGPGAGIPTGTVTFLDGTTVLAVVPVVDGVATFQVSTLAAGQHVLSAVYSGSEQFQAAASGAVLQSVGFVTLVPAKDGQGPLLSIVGTADGEVINLAGGFWGRRVAVTASEVGSPEPAFSEVFRNQSLPPIGLVTGLGDQTIVLKGRFVGPVILQRVGIPAAEAKARVTLSPSGGKTRTLTIDGGPQDSVINVIGSATGRRVRVVIRHAGQQKPVFTQTFSASRLSKVVLGVGSGSQTVRVRGRLAMSLVFRGTGASD